MVSRLEGRGRACVFGGVRLLRPASRGLVSLRSGDPKAAPRILLNLLQASDDRVAFKRIMRFVRRFFLTSAAQELVREETIPGEIVSDDDGLDAFVRANVRTAMHPVGTCAMGVDNGAVVDAD